MTMPVTYKDYTDAEIEAMERQWITDEQIRKERAAIDWWKEYRDRLVSLATPQTSEGAVNAQREREP